MRVPVEVTVKMVTTEPIPEVPLCDRWISPLACDSSSTRTYVASALPLDVLPVKVATTSTLVPATVVIDADAPVTSTKEVEVVVELPSADALLKFCADKFSVKSRIATTMNIAFILFHFVSNGLLKPEYWQIKVANVATSLMVAEGFRTFEAKMVEVFMI